MSRSLRVMIIVSFANLGGAQIAALRLARGLRERGHDPTVLFLYQQGTIDTPDYDFEVLLPTARPGLRGYLRMSWDLCLRLRKEKPHIVLTFLPLANVLGQSAAFLARVRRRIVSHRIPVNTIRGLMRPLDAAAAWLGLYTEVVAVSDSVRRSCSRYPAWLRGRTVVVHNGLRDWIPSTLSREEARLRFGIADVKTLLVAVGRLAPQKNYPLMLRVMQRLEGAILLIAGDGPLRAELELEIERLGVNQKVRLLGRVPRTEVPDLLAAADLFVQTSSYEGQSNAVLEALQTGLPIVAHDLPENRETIVDLNGSIAGALVPVEDVDAWVVAIEGIRNDSAANHTAKEVAATRARMFGYDAMIVGFERALTGDDRVANTQRR